VNGSSLIADSPLGALSVSVDELGDLTAHHKDHNNHKDHPGYYY